MDEHRPKLRVCSNVRKDSLENDLSTRSGWTAFPSEEDLCHASDRELAKHIETTNATDRREGWSPGIRHGPTIFAQCDWMCDSSSRPGLRPRQNALSEETRRVVLLCT